MKSLSWAVAAAFGALSVVAVPLAVLAPEPHCHALITNQGGGVFIVSCYGDCHDSPIACKRGSMAWGAGVWFYCYCTDENGAPYTPTEKECAERVVMVGGMFEIDCRVVECLLPVCVEAQAPAPGVSVDACSC